jgi:hypothetical protein
LQNIPCGAVLTSFQLQSVERCCAVSEYVA